MLAPVDTERKLFLISIAFQRLYPWKRREGWVKALSNCQRDVTQASNDPILPRLDQPSNICCMSAWPSVDSSPSKRPLA
jgi:hypothetical protein